MTQFVKFVKIRALDKGIGIMKLIDGVPVLAVKANDNYYAYVAVCDHKQHILCNREVVDGNIVCPGHGEKFDATTGEPKIGLAKRKLIRLKTTIKDNTLYIENPSTDIREILLEISKS